MLCRFLCSRPLLEKLIRKSSANVVQHTGELTQDLRAKLMSDYDRGKQSIMLYLDAKFGFWGKLPYLLIGAAHDDQVVARRVACRAVEQYRALDENGRIRVKHMLTDKFLDAAAPGNVSKQFFDFSVGRSDRTESLEKMLVPLRLVLVIEMSVEAKHAIAKNKLKGKKCSSAASFSLALRMNEIKAYIDQGPAWLERFAHHFASLRRPHAFIAGFDMIDLPCFTEVAEESSKTLYKMVRRVFYHADLCSQYKRVDKTNKHFPGAFAAADGNGRKTTGAQGVSYALGNAVRQHVQGECDPYKLYTCSTNFCFGLESLNERLYPPDAHLERLESLCEAPPTGTTVDGEIATDLCLLEQQHTRGDILIAPHANISCACMSLMEDVVFNDGMDSSNKYFSGW